MSFYFDTSFAVTIFTAEERTPLAQAWIAEHIDQEFYISDWTKAEFSSALSMKIRTGALTLETRAKVLSDWRVFEAASLGNVAVSPEDFLTATRYSDRHELSLRASDALHIAIAYGAGLTLVTLDKRMAKAALEFGVPVAEFFAD